MTMDRQCKIHADAVTLTLLFACCFAAAGALPSWEERSVALQAFNLTTVGPPAEEPASITHVERQYAGATCTQETSCQFYADILLVIKLNPVRMLWADALLNFYSTGFQHIVFFSALQARDSSRGRYVLIGPRRIKVHLVDDNYGFCDHFNVALAMQWWPEFTGYVYLSDDVFFPFWSSVGKDKARVWRQIPERGSSSKLTVKEREAFNEIVAALPFELGRQLDVANPPFALTSGIYYVPRRVYPHFGIASAILLRHRTYNEWGTPALLSVVDRSTFIPLRGKLVWGTKRLLVRKMMLRPFEWYHPVRASGELFTRLLHLVHSTQLTAAHVIDTSAFFAEPCLDCATYPLAQRKTKGLYHSCVVVENPAAASEVCGRNDQPLDSYAPQHWPVFRHARLVGGRVGVHPVRANTRNPLELRHEGFWNKDITLFVFNEFYAHLNTTQQHSPMLGRFRDCCIVGGPP